LANWPYNLDSPNIGRVNITLKYTLPLYDEEQTETTAQSTTVVSQAINNTQSVASHPYARSAIKSDLVS
jgi:hypothetical protein